MAGDFFAIPRTRVLGPSVLAAPRFANWLSRTTRFHRAPLVIAVYLSSIAGASYLAFWLRFEGEIPPREYALWLTTLPWLMALSAAGFLAFGLQRTIWRFASVIEFRDLVGAVIVSWVAFYMTVRWILAAEAYPRSVHIIGVLLSIAFVAGVRVVRRVLEDGFGGASGKRVLIVGAGSAGETVVRDLLRNGYRPIGFIDDDPEKLGRWIHRVRVLGSREDLAGIVMTETPDEVLIAMPSAALPAVRQVVAALEPFKIPITTVPPLREIVDGTVAVSQVRRLKVEDLLPRAPVMLDTGLARDLLHGRRVMVTGAGGSIGSELARQIAAFEPERLLLYERYENNLYTVFNTLNQSPKAAPILGDVTDIARLHAVMREHRPQVVFHAAAHKHVPLTELNPCEAVKNNVTGTRRVAEAAVRFGADQFVLISTDKAVNPTSLMGATKRVAELIVQSMVGRGHTRWVTVRFGNVLASNGSVIPRWLEQIEQGGPVTVTHPEVRRFFMLIPEAVQLILQSSAVTRNGDIFALEMGEQIPLLDMARTLIRLSGYVPDEIPIAVVGLRPGEKLSEELVGSDERVDSSPSEKILRLSPVMHGDAEETRRVVARLGTAAAKGDIAAVLSLLIEIVPTFQPDPGLSGLVRERRPVARLPRSRHVLRPRLGPSLAAISAAGRS
jgi:FlaA1/EpsC-like NDP-sugar epimerase